MIKKIDIFTTRHPTEIGDPIIVRKTRFGGVFTIVFIFAVIAIVIASIVTYLLDNITEIRSLVPKESIEEDITADSLEITVTFYRYYAACLEENECNKINVFSDSGISYSSKSVKCEMLSTDCIVKFKYSDVQIASNSELNLQMLESTAFASAVSVNIICSSSLEDSSEVFVPVHPDSPDKVFKGLTPTVIEINFIPTVI